MLAVSTIRGVSFDGALTVKVFPSKVKFASPTRFVPLPPVMIRLSALLDIVADPVAP